MKSLTGLRTLLLSLTDSELPQGRSHVLLILQLPLSLDRAALRSSLPSAFCVSERMAEARGTPSCCFWQWVMRMLLLYDPVWTEATILESLHVQAPESCPLEEWWLTRTPFSTCKAMGHGPFLSR